MTNTICSSTAPEKATATRPRSPGPSRPFTRNLGALCVLGALAACNGGGSDDTLDPALIVEHWNHVSIDASGLDHVPTNVVAPHTFGEQLGPCRSARAMAIVHLAIFEAVNAVEGGYQSYVGLAAAPAGTNLRAAIGQAAHDTLNALYPSQSAQCDAALATELSVVPQNTARQQGVALGAAAAAAVLALRANDGSDHPEPVYGVDYLPSDQPGAWRQDPISLVPIALGANWDQVTPFVMTSASQFRIPPPPALNSAEYALAFDEVKVLGGDGDTTPTARPSGATIAGLYWAYDGTPSLCAPPRLYNQIATQLAMERHLSVLELSRLLALVNVAMADAGIAAWESKYFYAVWRPVTGIREADAGTGPSGLGDGNAATVGDAAFTPLGAPRSNGSGPNFTPPFPAYPSGHATFGGALFQTLRRYFGTDDIEFTFVSDEFNGITVDNQGDVRPLIPRTFHTLSEAEEENGQSRIYLGIHWSFDKTEGIAQGRAVADYVFDSILEPVP